MHHHLMQLKVLAIPSVSQTETSQTKIIN